MAWPVRGLVVLILLMLGSTTYVRAQAWQSELTLWTDAAAKTPQKPRPFINLGLARELAGDVDGALQAQQAALALSFQPRLTVYQQNFSRVASETNIARVLAQHGQEEAALRLLNDVVSRHPLFPHARHNRGVLLARLGRCDEANQDLALAKHLEPAFQEFRCQPE